CVLTCVGVPRRSTRWRGCVPRRPTNLGRRVRKLGRLVRAKAVTEDAAVACVFVHEDLDEPDGDRYPVTRERVQRALEREFGNAHYVLAVAEMEAWLLLFPECLDAFAKGWHVPAQAPRPGLRSGPGSEAGPEAGGQR